MRFFVGLLSVAAQVAGMQCGMASNFVYFGEPQIRPPTAEEVAAGVPPDYLIHEFFIEQTSEDILSLQQVVVSLRTFDIAASEGGSHTTDYGPVLGFLNPAIYADSFITTPGRETSCIEGRHGCEDVYFDTSNDGPLLSPFKFARLTTPADERGVFSGRFSLRANPPLDDFFYAPFSFRLGVPEPASAGLCGVALFAYCCRRRRDNPPR